MDYIKVGKDVPDGSAFLREICAELKVSKHFARLLFARGIDTKEKANEFLNVKIEQLGDPFLFADMNKIVNRIWLAKKNGEKVVIFGDYDVDGISATYILLSHLRSLGIDVNAHIPHRIADGYGLTDRAIREVKEKYNCTLIITVDCGISCIKEIEFAKTLGIEVAVTDHHIVPECKPNALIINPKNNCGYPFDCLCGAGVALKVVQALSGTSAIQKYLCVAALATVADIVPLTLENRAIVKLGLASAKKYFPIGIKKLMEICGIKKISSQNVSFRLAPKINAPGRLGDSQIALDLFLEQDEQKAIKIAEQIFAINSKRQDIGAAIYDDCLAQIDKLDITSLKCIVLKDNDWEAGLLGIACAKIATKFNRPVFLFALHDGVLKGSVRGIDGINIVDALSQVKSSVINFGGHEMAAGLSIEEGKFEEFKRKIEIAIENSAEAISYSTKLEYDIEVAGHELTFGFAKELELLEPTGCENNIPVIKTTVNGLKYSPSMNNREHLVLTYGKNRLLCFNGLKFVNVLETKGPKTLLVEHIIDEYNNKQCLKTTVKHIAPAVISDNKNIYAGLAAQHIFNLAQNNDETNLRIYEAIKPNKYGSIYVSFNHAAALNLASSSELNLEIFTSDGYNGESLVCLAPIDESALKNYQKVWFIDDAIPLDLAKKIAKNKNVEVYLPKNHKSFVPNVSTNRDVFAKVFKYIRENSQYIAIDILNFYNHAKFAELGVSLTQFTFCLAVFIELDFVQLEEKPYYYRLSVSKSPKRDLKDSKTYCKY